MLLWMKRQLPPLHQRQHKTEGEGSEHIPRATGEAAWGEKADVWAVS